MPLPRVAIVGRPNVGKSSILNMLAKAKLSIVDPTPGTTRDRVTAIVELTGPLQTEEPRLAELTDTGGYGVYTAEDGRFDDAGEDLSRLTDDIEHQIASAVERADLILFVIDAQAGITALDETVAKLLRERALGGRGRQAIPIIQVANKVDADKWEAHGLEAAALGFGEPWLVSAANNFKRRSFTEQLFEALPETTREDEQNVIPEMKLAIVGKRNAGKSSITNALAGEARVIVSEIAGTTRDAVDVRFEMPVRVRVDQPTVIDEGEDDEEDALEAVFEGVDGFVEAEDQEDLQEVNEAHVTEDMIDAQGVQGTAGHEGFDPSDFDFEEEELTEEQIAELDAQDGVERVAEDAAAGQAEDIQAGGLTFSAVDGRQPLDPDDIGEAWTGIPDEAVHEADRAATPVTVPVSHEPAKPKYETQTRTFVAIDTAGVRKRTKFADAIEVWANDRAQRSIRRADVCLLVIDATEKITGVDKRLGRQLADEFKPTVIVINKWDLAKGRKNRKGEEISPEDYQKYVEKELVGLGTAPIVFTSAKEVVGLKQAVETALELHRQARIRMSTGKLNRTIENILTTRGPSSSLGTKAKLLYASQVAVAPPTLLLVVNKPELFDDRYTKYLLNRFRETLPFEEVPIRLIIRERRRADLDEMLSGEHRKKKREQG